MPPSQYAWCDLTSSLTWLDFSDAERRRALQVVELFAVHETRDELGLGAIRDALAEAMFPGVSTVQRRARYFLFVPWIFKAAESKGGDVLGRSRKAELALIGALAEAGETDGVIGGRAGTQLKQLPSMIYWQGLERWGIRRRRGTREQWARSTRRHEATDDGDRLGPLSWWHDNLVDPPEDFPQCASLLLTRAEAQYLAERVVTFCPGTLLAWLVARGVPWQHVDFAWEMPMRGELSDAHARQVDHAQRFSETMNGAALLYNLMLAEETEEDDLRAGYEQDLVTWRALAGHDWDVADFWTLMAELGSRHDARARRFVDKWIEIVRSWADPRGSSAARELVRSREHEVKRRYARLSYESARDTWRGAAGARQLDFRWGSAQRQVLDVVRGIGAA